MKSRCVWCVLVRVVKRCAPLCMVCGAGACVSVVLCFWQHCVLSSARSGCGSCESDCEWQNGRACVWRVCMRGVQVWMCKVAGG